MRNDFHQRVFSDENMKATDLTSKYCFGSYMCMHTDNLLILLLLLSILIKYWLNTASFMYLQPAAERSHLYWLVTRFKMGDKQMV